MNAPQDTKIENQEAIVESLKNQMPIWDDPWPTARYHYIATSAGDLSNDGIDYVQIDEDHIAWRYSGDYRETGEWVMSTVERFREIVVEDAENTLDELKHDVEVAEA